MSELTFQVAMRTVTSAAQSGSAELGVDQHEEQLGLAGQLPADRGPTGALAGPGRHPAQRHLEVEQVARDHLAAEPGPLDPAEQRELAGEGRVGQHGHPAQLGQGLDHEHPGRVGRPGKCPAKKASSPVSCQLPVADWPGSTASELGDEEEGVAMGQVVLGSHDRRGYRSR